MMNSPACPTAEQVEQLCIELQQIAHHPDISLPPMMERIAQIRALQSALDAAQERVTTLEKIDADHIRYRASQNRVIGEQAEKQRALEAERDALRMWSASICAPQSMREGRGSERQRSQE